MPVVDVGPRAVAALGKYWYFGTLVGGLWATIFRAFVHEMRLLPLVMKTLNEEP